MTVSISDGLAGELTQIVALHDLSSYAEAIEYAADTTLVHDNPLDSRLTER